VFIVRALHAMGCFTEADRFHRFIERSSAGSAHQLQIMYAVDGKRRLTEIELDWLEGYQQSKPVRIGNLASEQQQFDIYGELLAMAWESHSRGRPIDQNYWEFLVDVVNTVCERWQEPDKGIWEIRDAPRHHVHSKLMCWLALKRGIDLAVARHLAAPVDHWAEARDKVRVAIEREGYHEERGVFVQAFDNDYLDAALLLMPRVEFIPYDDPRMVRTVDAIRRELDWNGLILRYTAPDSLPKGEGVFIPCTFWMVSCLAHQGRHEQAWEYYKRALACANDLGLFSEEFDCTTQQMLGNFPQGLTHVSQIMARLSLAKTA
jgi:GH15 family glucan-1,4-alpha-glucosidase